MTVRIEAPRNLNQDTFDGCSHFDDDGQERLEVDLRSCRFVDGYGMVTLLTAMTLNARSGIEVQMWLPRSQEARTYLARMRFFPLLHPGVLLDEEPPEIAEHPSLLVELAPINLAGGEHAIEQMCNFAWPQLPRELREPFVEALAEIGANVIQHSDAEVGFVCAQRFENPYQHRPPPRLQIAVGDAGIGIRTSLISAYPDVASMSDGEAISEAVKEGVTSKPGQSGVGLSTVRRYADLFGGVLRIRSGRGVLVRRKRRTSLRTVPGLPGTIVAVELASPGGAG